MNNKDFERWTEFRDKTGRITDTEYRLVCELHARYFNHRLVYPCKCSSKRIQKWIQQLNDLWEKV